MENTLNYIATVTPLKSGGYFIDIDNQKGVLFFSAKSANLFCFNLFANGLMSLEEFNKIKE